MRGKFILKVLIITIILISIYSIESYCLESGTTRMKINGEQAWTNITVSESYAECESLNSATSTLGTSALRAHLTTNADWSAMAIFSVSQYGGATNNSASPTNGNKSGIYNIGQYITQTTGILNTTTRDTNEYVKGLFNENGSVKKYVKQWPTSREETGFVGFNETWGWLGSRTDSWGNDDRFNVILNVGFFTVYKGINKASGWSPGTDGSQSERVTFRPVIWN